MWWWFPIGSVPEIEPHTLAKQLRATTAPLLLDVRSEPEFERSHIPGAVNLPITRFRRGIGELELPERVVAICLSAHRSIPAVRLLRKRGVDAQQLAGGMRAWWAAGLPVRRA